MWEISDDDGRILLYDCLFSTAEKAIKCVVGNMASAHSHFTYDKIYDEVTQIFTIRITRESLVTRFYVRKIPVDII